MHAEGQPYFQNTENRRFCFLTEANLYDNDVLMEVNSFMEEVERVAIRYPELSSKIEVVLQPTDELWLYYMVDLEYRHVFWMHNVTLDENIFRENFGVERVEQLSESTDLRAQQLLVNNYRTQPG